MVTPWPLLFTHSWAPLWLGSSVWVGRYNALEAALEHVHPGHAPGLSYTSEGLSGIISRRYFSQRRSRPLPSKPFRFLVLPKKWNT
ncbi:hypothetical protein F5Y17DRAFT_246493 [Xylariaceae sp. FL0594]|nr:hypothetical protein F5Y17DRAFT_246493 [Xylariaceae sp. FL0594]